MRRLTKLITRTGSGIPRLRDWPVLLVFAVTLVPTVCLVWFMNAAVQNERLAVKEKLVEAYRAHISTTQDRIGAYCTGLADELGRMAATGISPAAIFRECVQEGVADSVIVLNEHGRPIYPQSPFLIQAPKIEQSVQWNKASAVERTNPALAALEYAAIAKLSSDSGLAARALQAQTRCLVQSGQRAAAIQIVTDVLGQPQFKTAVDIHGRSIAANAELLVLDLVNDPLAPIFQSTGERLARRLMDYRNTTMPASQRMFLMNELKKRMGKEFSTLAAEELAVRLVQSEVPVERDATLRRAGVPGVWQFALANARIVALFQTERLVQRLQAASEGAPSAVTISILPPGKDDPAALVTATAGAQLPDWHVALSVKDNELFEAATKQRVALYLWAGTLVIAAMFGLAVLGGRLLRRQMALAQLRNDLAATVSHELKTPIASMRVLVDTLLDAKRIEEPRTREYLQLMAKESDRLNRLVESFLTFSRLERDGYSFEFIEIPAESIIDRVVGTLQGRIASMSGVSFDVEVERPLPCVRADVEALATALLNIIDNALKYSEDIKRIVFRARSDGNDVFFEVEDNGIGIPAREVKKIFRRFYQVDRRLSQHRGGCGLGLSIVQFIVRAHDGRVLVESEPGRGSTFTVVLPKRAPTVMAAKEIPAL